MWTTGTELWAELVKVLSDFEAAEHAEAFPALASQVKTVLMPTASHGGRAPVGQLLISPVEPAAEQLVLPIDRSVAVKVLHLLVPYESQTAVLADEMEFVGEADLHPPSAPLSSMQAVTPD